MIPAILLIVSAVAYRVATGLLITSGAGWLSNFAPLSAIALCAAAYFPPKYKFSVPLIALFVSDAILDLHYGVALIDPLILCRYFAFVVVGLIGLALRNRASFATLLPASILGSSIFYVITNVVRLAHRSRLCKKFRRTDSGAHRWSPAVQRDAELDVFPQLAAERSFLHVAVCRCMSVGRSRARAGADRGLASRRVSLRCSGPSNATRSRCSR